MLYMVPGMYDTVTAVLDLHERLRQKANACGMITILL